MSPNERTFLTGAESGHVVVISIGTAAAAVKSILTSADSFDFEVVELTENDGLADQLARLAASPDPTRSGPDAAGVRVPDAVLVLGDTSVADPVAQAVAALAGNGPTARKRVWPAFVAGDPAELNAFDDALDELSDSDCDAVLMLTHAPSPEQAAQTLLAWLTVKLPAPASVLGQLPDASGRICRYVALGYEQVSPVAAPERAESGGDDTTAADSDAGDDLPDAEVAARLAACGEQLEQAVRTLAPAVALHERRDALDAAMAATDLASVIAAAQDLALATDTDIHPAVAALTAELAGEAAQTEPKPPAMTSVPDATVAGEPAGEPAGESRDALAPQPPSLTAALAAALAAYVVVAGRTGFGRMVSGGRRRQAGATLAAAADALVTEAERTWIAQAQHELRPAVRSAILQRRSAARAAAAETARRQAATAAEDWRADVERAVAGGRTWQHVDASRVTRSWGAGPAAPRKYVIGSGATFDSVIDLTDPGEPCLRVTTPTGTAAVIVLTAQYGLPLTALA